MKIAVVMATFNKENELPNALYALNLQQVRHDVEICIVDDCSNKDPKPIIDRFITRFPVKYKRLKEHAGVMFSHGMALDMTSDDVDVVVQPSCDVVCLMPNVINDLSEAVEDKVATFAGVMDTPVVSDFYKQYDDYSLKMIKGWNDIPRVTGIEINGRRYDSCSTIYSGKPQCSWLFFMGAMSRQNFYDIGFNYLSCDAYMHPTMREMGFRAKLLPWLRCVHQRHKKEMYKCNLLDHCPYWCIQKDWAKE